jgi:predicted ATPase/DNA-binding CsgD family transcriptional regulator/DNA-binding XRE family transcriptional regulator
MNNGPTGFRVLLQQYRTLAGLTQYELAARAGLSRRGISDLERGARHAPYPATVRRLADALGLSQLQRARLLEVARVANRRASLAPAPVPVPLTSFIGREREVLELRTLLQRCRLLTLTGSGGVGKTRLAIELVTALPTTHSGGSVVVELAILADCYLVPQAVAMAVGIPEQPGRGWMEVLSEALRGRELVLVLDNCEHVIAACAELAAGLLPLCPRLQIVATSRERLGVVGEVTWQVPPLSLPSVSAAQTAARVAESEAIQLFVERAAAAVPGFALSDRNALAIAQLCHRLQGIPLALELAAARVRLLSVEQICERLDDALGLLVSGNRSAPARQQTLRATLEWSCALLTPAEQQLFHHLSVFAGGWTLEAAEAICGDDAIQEHVLELLGQLVEKSLVICERRDEGPVRYRLLEALRQLAVEQLVAVGEVEQVRERHLEWFGQMAERTANELTGRRQALWFDWLQRELGNLRAALDWALESKNASAGLRLAVAMRRFWFHGHQTEGQRYLQALLELPVAADPAASGAALAALGSLTRERGDLELARSYGEQAVRLAHEFSDARAQFNALTVLGWTVAFQGDWLTADTLFRQASEVAERAGAWELASSVQWVGQLRALQGQYAQAGPMLERSLAQMQDLGDNENVARCLCALADIALRQGRFGDADRSAREALGICRDLGYAWAWAARALDIMVRLAALRHQPERAVRLAAAASIMHSRLGRLLPRMSKPDVVESARAELGSEKAGRIWDEGQAMTTDEAIVFALDARRFEAATREGARADRGTSPLTPREQETAKLVRRGLTNRQIGEALVITEGTAALHVKNALCKLGFQSRAQLAVWVAEHGDLSTA